MTDTGRQSEGWLKLPSRLFDAFVSGFNGGGSVWIFCLMSLLCADVLFRALLNAPINGVPLLVQLSILVIVFMQLPAAIRDGRLTRSDVLLAGLLKDRPSIGLSLSAIYDALGVLLMLIVFFYTLPAFEKVWRRDTYEGLEGDFGFKEFWSKNVSEK